MAALNPIQLQTFLKGVSYPAGTLDLVEHARGRGADENLLSTLERLPDELYRTPADVGEAVGTLE